MNFLQEQKNDIYIITINKEIANIELTQEFKQMLFELIESGANKILIDFTNVGLIDSTFLGSIVVSHKKISETGGKLTACSLSENVYLSFGLSKINTVVDLFESREDAISNF